jgi:hypothetical protein
VLAEWKEHFGEHLNESEQPTRPVIPTPSREEIGGALKYLKNNKAAGVDSIAAELLKNGEPNLVEALHEHEVIHQAWTRETLPRSWTEGYCVQCTRRAINLIVETIEGFAS